MLGAWHAQHRLRLAAIGGKDSMSGSFNNLDVPPTLVAFALAPGKAGLALSPEFKEAGNLISIVVIERDSDRLPDFDQLRSVADKLYDLNVSGKIRSLHHVGKPGIAAAIAIMGFGNHIGAEIHTDLDLAKEHYFAFLIEHVETLSLGLNAVEIGRTNEKPVLVLNSAVFPLDELKAAWTAPLESIYPTQGENLNSTVTTRYFKEFSTTPISRSSRRNAEPKVLIPTFPGTNSEYDSWKAFQHAGAKPEILVFRNLTSHQIEESLELLSAKIRQSQILMIPGGFSAGDEPDGSAKFIATVLRNSQVADAVMDLLNNRDGLILGICNGFQALIKTGLVPYGEIRDASSEAPTLVQNGIGRHISCYARTRVVSNLSPWMAECQLGEIHRIPLSHGEGRFYATPELILDLGLRGQITTTFCDEAGVLANHISTNPNGSAWGVEGITSPCGRVFGKMAHTERAGKHVAKNVSGNKIQPIFSAGVRYFL